MWRAFFLGIGISLCLFGVEAMGIEKAVLNSQDGLVGALVSRGALGVTQSPAGGQPELVPAEWAPWGLISMGVVVILYSFSLPRRVWG
jgi:hypothetical protein